MAQRLQSDHFRREVKSSSWLWGLVSNVSSFILFFALSIVSASAQSPDDVRTPTLLFTGYSHLDSQWLWTYRQTLATYLPLTVAENLRDLRTFPEYHFNFTGSLRYRLIEAHYPELAAEMEKSVAEGKWIPAGSSVDESDLLVPSPESVIRQVLYGNSYFKEKFGSHTSDFLAPDAFGFRAHLPTTLVHAGVSGFTTQKLEWGLAVPKPFDLGYWEGADGSRLLSAFSPGLYSAGIDVKPHENVTWRARVFDQLQRFGLPFDMRFLGAGDSGGSPGPISIGQVAESVRHLLREEPKSAGSQGSWHVEIAASDALFERTLRDSRFDPNRLATYRGPLLLTKHSAGTLTSNAWSKKWNRAAEDLGSMAERASVSAAINGLLPYPHSDLDLAWELLLGSQMHDILPGTSVPDAYLLSHQDQFLALQIFKQVLARSVTRLMETRIPAVRSTRLPDVNGVAKTFAVYNPLPESRQALVELIWAPRPAEFEGKLVDDDAGAFCFVDDAGDIVRHQTVPGLGDTPATLFLEVHVKALSVSAYHLVTSGCPAAPPRSIALPVFEVGADFDQTELLKSSASESEQIEAALEWMKATGRLELQSEHPEKYPAWNMDWADRRRPAAFLESDPQVVEHIWGPLVAGWILKSDLGGSVAHRRLIFEPKSANWMLDLFINWRSSGFSLKLKTPFAERTEQGVLADGGVLDEAYPVNSPRLYEFPTYRWVSLGAQNSARSLSQIFSYILNKETYGFDRPSDRSLRHTLLYSPQTRRGGKHYHSTQDFGRHSFSFAFGPVSGGSLRQPPTTWLAADRFAFPLLAFVMREPSLPIEASAAPSSDINPSRSSQATRLPLSGSLQLTALKAMRTQSADGPLDPNELRALARFANRGGEDVHVNTKAVARDLLKSLSPKVVVGSAQSAEPLLSWVRPCSGAERPLNDLSESIAVQPSGLISICFAVRVHGLDQHVHHDLGADSAGKPEGFPHDEKQGLSGMKSLVADERRRSAGDCMMEGTGGCFRALDFAVPSSLGGPLTPGDLSSVLTLQEGGPGLVLGNASALGWLELLVTPESGGVFTLRSETVRAGHSEPLSSSVTIKLPAWDDLIAKADERVWNEGATVSGISPGGVSLDPFAELAWIGTSRLLPADTVWTTPSFLAPTVDPYHRTFVYRVWVPVSAGQVTLSLEGDGRSASRRVFLVRKRFVMRDGRASFRQPPATLRSPWAGLDWLQRSRPEDASVNLAALAQTRSSAPDSSRREVRVRQRPRLAADRQVRSGPRSVSARGPFDEWAGNPEKKRWGGCDTAAPLQNAESVQISPASRFQNEIGEKMEQRVERNLSACFSFEKPVQHAFIESEPCRVHQGHFPASDRFFGVVRVWMQDGSIFEGDVDGFHLAPGGKKVVEVDALSDEDFISRVCVYPANRKDGFNVTGAWGAGAQ